MLEEICKTKERFGMCLAVRQTSEASKARDLVLAFVPTSAVGCAGRWHDERQKQLEVEREVEREVLRTRSSSDGSSLGIDT